MRGTDTLRSAGLRAERIKASCNAEGGRFRNLADLPPGSKPVLPSSAAEWLRRGSGQFPGAPLPVHDPRERWTKAPRSGLRVAWLGHSTLLLEVDGLRVLTDPVFSERVSPVSFWGPRRFHRAPVSVGELPALDVLLISHDHADHLCKTTLRELARRPPQVVVPLGVGAHLESCGLPATCIHELDWYESVQIAGARLTATPAQHFSGRGLLDRNRTLWSSFVIETERRKLFFGGDSGLFPQLSHIGQTYGPFDLTILEVGGDYATWGTLHMGPKDAVAAHELLGGHQLLPMHWGTFDLADHGWDQPAEELFQLSASRGVHLLLPELGQAVEPVHQRQPVPWWRRVAHAAKRR